MTFPNNCKYTKEHEWVRIEGNNAYIGITDFAQHELGEIVYVDINTVGETLQKEETFGSIEAVKTVSDLFMPIGGKILEMNQELEDKPELVNEDPYINGWLIKVEISDSSEINDLMDTKEYQQFIGQ